MNEDLDNEVEVINSIYGDGSLTTTDVLDVYILHLPQHATSLRLRFPSDYPSSPPIVSSHSSGEHTRKGAAAYVVDIFQDVMGRLFQPGEVCLFDVIEEVNTILPAEAIQDAEEKEEPNQQAVDYSINATSANDTKHDEVPPWVLSDVVIELKSVFVARAAQVSSTDQAKQYLQHLLNTDKKVRSATHNITAWRIKGENGVIYQDCDDDGETAAGGRVLHLMQLMELWNTMVVVTRWYGGHQLGPKRFSIINTVARDAFVKGNFVEDTAPSKKKGKR
jgi:hypothetical protein